MKASNKHFIVKVAVVWGLCALAVMAFYLGVVFPAQRSARQVSRRLEEITGRYEEACGFVHSRRLEEMRRKVDLLRAEMEKYLVGNDAARDSASRISRIAERAKIKGYSTRYRNSSLIDELDNCLHVGASWVNISWKGDFEQFTRLINELERHRPVVFVDSFLISKPDNPAQGCRIELSLIILVDTCNGALAGSAEKPAEV